MLKGPLKLFEDGDYEHCTDELKNARNGGKGNRIFKVTVLKAEVLFLTVLSIPCFSVRSFYSTFFKYCRDDLNNRFFYFNMSTIQTLMKIVNTVGI